MNNTQMPNRSMNNSVMDRTPDENSTEYDQSVYQPAVPVRSMNSGIAPTGMSRTPNMSSGPNASVQIINSGNSSNDESNFVTAGGDESYKNPVYVPGYLCKMIGKWVRLEMLIGSSMVARTGRLSEVGASFVVLQSPDANAQMMCDIYSIKFVGVVNNMDFMETIYHF